jgi:hypothetical protein
MSAYEARPVKRQRRTNAELEMVDDAIYTAVATEHPTTLRGVYYRVVSAGAVEKTEHGYGLIGRQLLKLRRTGAVPYNWITDGTRLIQKPDSWSALDRMLESAAASYRRALWDDQSVEVMILSEKDAISGAIYPVTAEFDVELCITRGYSSETFTHGIAETVQDNHEIEKTTYLYQLGDHDPSGVDAWRSFQERVRGFAPEAYAVFERLAVTPEQIEDYDLPTRPTKTKDTRAAAFAGESVEVDALPATVLRSIVRQAIEQHIDPHALRLTEMAEREERDLLTRMRRGLAS